jgi:transcriptional regulator with XRE-family HTH domain
MTMTIATGTRAPGSGSDPNGLLPGTRPGRLGTAPSIGRLATAILARPRQARRHASPASRPVPAGGAIGGAVVAAARRSAGLTRRNLARRLGVTPATVRAWETGALPLYRVSYRQLGQLAAALSPPARLGIADLVMASQCDLLVAGMLGGFEDYAEVPPLDDQPGGQAARALLRWALTGDVPEPYRQHARPGPLLGSQDTAALTTLARDLAAGESGPELASYGAALLGLAAR